MINDSLALTIMLPGEARAGEALPLTMTLTNVSGRIVEVHLQGRQTVFDFVVTRVGEARPVWRRLEGAVVQAILQLRPLQPREALEFRATWDQRGTNGRPVPPGRYQVVGELPGDGPPLRTNPTAFEIVAR